MPKCLRIHGRGRFLPLIATIGGRQAEKEVARVVESEETADGLFCYDHGEFTAWLRSDRLRITHAQMDTEIEHTRWGVRSTDRRDISHNTGQRETEDRAADTKEPESLLGKCVGKARRSNNVHVCRIQCVHADVVRRSETQQIVRWRRTRDKKTAQVIRCAILGDTSLSAMTGERPRLTVALLLVVFLCLITLVAFFRTARGLPDHTDHVEEKYCLKEEDTKGL